MSRGVGKDGIKRGTNYIHRDLIEQRRRAQEAGLIAYFSQSGRCAKGDHDETEAAPRRVTYVGGRQVPPGTRYCQYCSAILDVGHRKNGDRRGP